MAIFEVTGIGSLGAELKAFSDGIDQITDEMLVKGGEIVAKEWKREAQAAGHRDPQHSDHMIDSIKPGKPEDSRSGYRYIEIFPRGNYPDRRDGKGRKVSHAKVAAILNYGKSGMLGSGFVKKAEKAAEKQLETLEEKLLDEYTKKKGLN